MSLVLEARAEAAKTIDTFLQHRALEVLKPHPINEKIYGDAETLDPEFVEDIRQNGVQTPLVITSEDVIIGGHRRWMGAQQAGRSIVPVVVLSKEQSKDELYLIERLIRLNSQRHKTDKQIHKEIEAMTDVAKKRADQRRQEGNAKGGRAKRGEGKSTVPVRSTSDGRPAAKDIADVVGTSTRTVENSLAVTEGIKEAEQAGDTELKTKIEHTLETRGFKPAADVVRKAKKKKAEELLTAVAKELAATPHETVALFDQFEQELTQARGTLQIICPSALPDLDAVLKLVNDHRPVAIRDGSQVLVSKMEWAGMSKEERQKCVEIWPDEPRPRRSKKKKKRG